MTKTAKRSAAAAGGPIRNKRKAAGNVDDKVGTTSKKSKIIDVVMIDCDNADTVQDSGPRKGARTSVRRKAKKTATDDNDFEESDGGSDDGNSDDGDESYKPEAVGSRSKRRKPISGKAGMSGAHGNERNGKRADVGGDNDRAVNTSAASDQKPQAAQKLCCVHY